MKTTEELWDKALGMAENVHGPLDTTVIRVAAIFRQLCIAEELAISAAELIRALKEQK